MFPSIIRTCLFGAWLLGAMGCHNQPLSNNLSDDEKTQLCDKINRKGKFAADLADVTRETAAFDAYVVSLRDLLIERAGGMDSINAYNSRKEVVEQVLFEEKGAYVLEEHLVQLSAILMQKAGKKEQLKAALGVPQALIYPDPERRDWAHYRFKDMPLRAVFPILGYLRELAKKDECLLISYWSRQ